jgi:hypothetical protein
MKKLLFTLLLTGIIGASAAAAVGQVTPGADRRQRNQKYRIENGIKSGQITKREAKSIRRSVRSAKRYERRAKSDGKVTWKERARLQHRQNVASRKIYRTKHNKRTR